MVDKLVDIGFGSIDVLQSAINKRKSQYGGFNFGDTDDDILTIDVEENNHVWNHRWYANSFKVKYVYLDKMFNGHLTDTTKNGKRIVNTANIYINFESLYNCIRNTHVEKYLRVANKKEVNEIYRNMISKLYQYRSTLSELLLQEQDKDKHLPLL